MSNSSDELALALLATLEAQARKKGKKSVAKQVASRLRDGGASDELIRQVQALNSRKSPPAAAKPVRAKARSKAKSPSKAVGAAQPTA
jgi:DNA-binding protein H-NS